MALGCNSFIGSIQLSVAVFLVTQGDIKELVEVLFLVTLSTCRIMLYPFLRQLLLWGFRGYRETRVLYKPAGKVDPFLNLAGLDTTRFARAALLACSPIGYL